MLMHMNFSCFSSKYFLSSMRGILRPYISMDLISISPVDVAIDFFTVKGVHGSPKESSPESISRCFSSVISCTVGRHGVEISPQIIGWHVLQRKHTALPLPDTLSRLRRTTPLPSSRRPRRRTLYCHLQQST